ncbi:MAG: hypothetical protein AAFY37_08655 [Pseudomonadota bacterium]
MALSGLAALCAPAFADGLVIETTSSAYAAGDVIVSGSEITLGVGEQVVVLDQSGEIVTVEETGAYDATSAIEAEDVDLIDAAFDPGRRADIGGTRAEDHDACVAAARERGDHDASHCDRAFPPEPVAPTLTIGTALRAGPVQPAAPLIFKLEATFDSMALCAASLNVEGAQTYPLEMSQDRGALRLMGDVPAMAPRRGSPRIVAPDAPGDYKVSCLAVDPQTWTAFSAAMADDASYALSVHLLERYASLRDAPMARTAMTVRVAE